MAQAIRVDSGFATARDTARILGVSKARTEALIKIARRYTDRILKRRASEAGESAGKDHSKRKSAAAVVGVRKSRGHDAGAKVSVSKSKKAKGKH
jgi:hypothetical protein